MHAPEALPPINWWTMYGHAPPMGWFLVDFLIFVTLMVWASRRPLRVAFRARHVAIRQSVSDAAAAHARASQEQTEARAKLLGLEAEVRELLQTSERDGQLERDRAIAEAEAYCKTLREEGSSVADQELKRARLRLKNKLVTEVIEEARSRVRDSLSLEQQERLIDRAISRLEQERPMAPSKRMQSSDASEALL